MSHTCFRKDFFFTLICCVVVEVLKLFQHVSNLVVKILLVKKYSFLPSIFPEYRTLCLKRSSVALYTTQYHIEVFFFFLCTSDRFCFSISTKCLSHVECNRPFSYCIDYLRSERVGPFTRICRPEIWSANSGKWPNPFRSP